MPATVSRGERLFLEAGKHLEAMQVGQALKLFRWAERAGYDCDQCAAGRWTCHMLAGDFELAWRESDAIGQRGEPDPNRFWDGRPLTRRRVLLRCLHGLGDTLQFIRYAPFIRQQAQSLTIEAQPALKPLLSQAALADHVITWGEAEPPWDQQVEIMELPRIFRTTLHNIPATVPYLNVSSIQTTCEVSLHANRTPPVIRVGIVWASSTYNPARSIPIACLSELFDTPGVAFFSLQAGLEQTQIDPWSARVPSLYDPSAGVLGTAHTLQRIDLVITVDTMMAHLAGAMGKPVWTLLPYESDWRWMLTREDSPWYPTMRLFRQEEAGCWTPIISRLRRELNALVASRYRLTNPWPLQPANLAQGA